MNGKNITAQQYSHENPIRRFLAMLHKPIDPDTFLCIGSYGPKAGPEHRIIARAARRIKAKVFEPLPLTEERMAAIRRLGYG